MATEIYGFNPSIKSLWDDIRNVFKIENPNATSEENKWLTASQWASLPEDAQMTSLKNLLGESVATQITRNGIKGNEFRVFYDAQKAYTKINKDLVYSLKSPSDMLDGYLKVMNMHDQSSFEQVVKASESWQTIIDLQKGIKNGYILGFDTETFGDIIHGESKYGITELAIGQRVYENGMARNTQGFSLAIGINKTQEDNLRALVSKFESKGWDSLSQPEQITLQRMSMAGANDNWLNVFHKTSIDLMGGKQMYIVPELANPTYNAATMRQGIANYRKLYDNGATAESVLPEFMKFMKSESDKGIVFVGANTGFDYNALRKEIGKLNIAEKDQYLSFIDELESKTVDITYGTRATAAVRTESADTMMQNTIGGIRGGGSSVQSHTNSMGMNRAQEHIGWKDVFNELDIVDYRNFNEKETYAEFIKRHTSGSDAEILVDARTRTYTADDTMFLVKNGKLDKTKKDFAVVNGGEGTQSYSIANEYWQLDAEHTGVITNEDGSTSFMLTMKNADDVHNGASNPTTFTKEFESVEDAITYLRKNTEMYSSSQILGKNGTAENLSRQVEFKYSDFGRREFDKLLDAGAVRVNGEEEVYGFEALKKYVQMAEADELNFSNLINSKQYKEAVNKTLEYAKEHNISLTEYQAQAFVGMYDRLSSQKSLFDKIIDSIDSNNSLTGNLSKTIAANNAYEQAMNTIRSQFKEHHTQKRSNVVTADTFGIDIASGGRIAAQNVEEATTGITRIFGKMSKEEQVKNILDLTERGLFTRGEARTFISQIEDTIETNGDRLQARAIQSSIEGNPLYQIYQDMGYALNSHYEEIMAGDKSVILAGKDFANKVNIGHSLYEDLTGISRFTGVVNGTKVNYTTSEAYEAIQHEVDEQIASAISSMPKVSLFSPHGKDLDVAYSVIRERLNIGNDLVNKDGKTDMFTQMFTSSKSYGLNNYEDKGLISLIVNPDNTSNSYLLVTDENNYASIIRDLSSGTNNDKLSSYSSIMDSTFADRAMIVELPHINKYTLSTTPSEGMKAIFGKESVQLTTINQGENFEKFLIGQFSTYTDKTTGQLKGYINNGVYDYFSFWRMGAGNTLEELVETRDWRKASTAMRRKQNAKLQELSSSASYRGYIDEVTGQLKRYTNYGPGDYLYAYQLNAEEGIHSVFDTLISDIDKDSAYINGIRNRGTKTGGYSTVDKIIDDFAEVSGKTRYRSESLLDFRKRISGDSEFEEFFKKNLFIGGDDLLSGNNIFSIVNETVQRNEDNLFDKSIQDAISSINIAVQGDEISQLLSHTASEKGIISLLRAGVFNDNAGLYSPMRPTYQQQNLGLGFDKKTEWNESLTSRFIEINDELSLPGIRAGGSTETKIERDIRKRIANSGYTGKPNSNYADQSRFFMGSFGQLSDYELQSRYDALLSDESLIAKYAEKYGITKEQYQEWVNYVRQDMNAVNEGKLFMDPRLAEQPFLKAPDLKKVEMNIDTIDIDKTRTQLQSLEDTIISRGDTIGFTKEGKEIWYSGSDVILKKGNIEELLKSGKTHAVPVKADIQDLKFMINGAEKGTAGAISVDNFMKYTGFNGTREQALDVISEMFYKVSKGANVIGNLNFTKHGNQPGLDSLWRLATSVYGESSITDSQRQSFIDSVNALLKTQVGGGSIVWEDGTFVVDNALISNLPEFLNRFRQGIFSDDSFGSKTVNARIRQIQEYFTENNLIYGAFERMNMNEHVADQMALDKRLEQAIRERSILYGEEDQWVDTLKEFASTYDGTRKENIDGISSTTEAFNNYYIKRNQSRIRATQGNAFSERTVRGSFESLMYYGNPNIVDISQHNIPIIDLNDFVNTNTIRSGMTVEDLQTSLFYIDGKASDNLRRYIDNSGVAESQITSMYLDFGQTVKIGPSAKKQEVTGILVPVQNVMSNPSNETFFSESQYALQNFIERYKKLSKNGQADATKIGALVDDYMKRMLHSMAYQDKNSDVYKLIQKTVMPNGGGYLAGQETPALFDEMYNNIISVGDESKSIKEFVSERQALEKRLSNFDELTSKELEDIAKRIDDIDSGIKIGFKKIADDLREGVYLEPKSLKGTKLEGITKQIINGKETYGYAVGISKAGFKEAGFDFGMISYDLVRDLQTNKGRNIPNRIIDTQGTRAFVISDSQMKSVIHGLQDLSQQEGFTDLVITNNGRNLAQDIENFLSIKDLNKAIVEKDKRTGAILKVFEDSGIADDFMRTVGVFGEAPRYPIFRSQLMAKFFLDDSIAEGALHQKIYTPIGTSLNNVDFDGDLLYSIFTSNGGSISMANSKNYTSALQEYVNQIGTTTELLAQLIEDGDVIKVTNPNNYIEQGSKIVEKFFNDKYQQQANILSQKLFGKSFKELTDGQIATINNSKEMFELYISTGINTLTNNQIQKASLAPNIRKMNIGAISTPGYTLRDSLMTVIESAKVNGNKEIQEEATDILRALTNMGSKKGGLLDSAEQLGIDTKHMLDALSTAQTMKFSAGLNRLYSPHNQQIKSLAQLEKIQKSALTDVTSAIYNQVFEKSKDKETVSQIVDFVMTHTRKQMSEMEGITDLNAKMGLRALIDAQTIFGSAGQDIDRFSKIWRNKLRKGTFDEEVFNLLTELRTTNYELYRGTNIADVLPFIQEVFSDTKFEFQGDKMYYVIGDVANKAKKERFKWNDYAYQFTGFTTNKQGQIGAAFDRYIFDKEKGFIKTKPFETHRFFDTVEDLSKHLSETLHLNPNNTIGSAYQVMHSGTNEYLKDAVKTMTRAREAKILSSIFYSKEGKVLSSTEAVKRFDDFLSIINNPNKDIDNMYGRTALSNVNTLYFAQSSKGNIVGGQQAVGKISEMLQGYEYEVMRRPNSIPTNELLTQINKQIADNPKGFYEQHGVDYGDTVGAMYKFMNEQLGGRGDLDLLGNAIQNSKQFANFNIVEYNKAVGGLPDNLYDVTKEQEILTKSYEEFRKTFGDIKEDEQVKSILGKQAEDLSKLQSSLESHNKRAISNVESTVYGLFNKNTYQMDMVKFFEWDKVSGRSVVGYGEYIGKEFKALSKKDIDLILSETREGLTDKQLFAYEKTQELLKAYRDRPGGISPGDKSVARYTAKRSSTLEQSLLDIDNATFSINRTQAYRKTLEEEAEKIAQQQSKNAAKRKNLGDALNIKQVFSNMNVKKVAGVGAVFAALGIASNVMHKRNNSSPLTPVRNDNSNSPDISTSPTTVQAPSSPVQQRRTVYHDNQTGYTFRVSGKSASQLTQDSYAKAVNNAGGGNATVNIRNDNSAITDNWLENKFAQLSG